MFTSGDVEISPPDSAHRRQSHFHELIDKSGSLAGVIDAEPVKANNISKNSVVFPSVFPNTQRQRVFILSAAFFEKKS